MIILRKRQTDSGLKLSLEKLNSLSRISCDADHHSHG